MRPAESAGKSEEPPKDDPKGEDPPPRPESPPAPAPEPSTEIAPRTSESKPPAPEAQPFPTPVPDPEENSPAHDQPDRNAPPSPPLAPGAQPQPQPDAAPGAPTKPAAAPGPPVSGELTEQEADPTSTVDVPAELWRNGKPLAAKGLRILTRRPQMLPEYLAIQTSAGRNPVFELNFDNQGLVRNVVVLEGSGAPELDDRLVDCLYKWRARGERLSTVKAGDRLKFTMRMLVR
ncbi:MAG: hypothetical protein FJ253_05155 [Phycisphaerae bacterium]|nr:hypothetical protein [Phycisphaerae bacterium]